MALLLVDKFVWNMQKEDKKSDSMIEKLIDKSMNRIQSVGQKNRNVTP